MKQKKDSEVEIGKLKFIQIGNSMVTLWHRPGVGDIRLLKELQGISLVVTLQSVKEHPKSIFKECAVNGIESMHVELNGANAAILSDKKTVATLKKSIRELTETLKTPDIEGLQRRVLIHCAAGIHRTGTVTYSLLRLDGKTPR